MSTSPVDRLNAALSGRYRIERELGEGGMATVYLADDMKHERKVALKVLKPELAAVVGAERFLAEIKTTANLQHPHILPLFDSGEADSFLYYVMPYVQGETLRDWIDRERQLAVEDAVRVAIDIAEALDHAHRQGVVHRDIKPANILMTEGRPLVADFGIALAVQQAGGGRLTETGLSLGTPYYMSPEQATADRDPDARSDVYSLACVLYEMLTGEPPHTGNSAQAVVGRILTATPEPVRDRRKSVPQNVEQAVAKALEKLPPDRFEGAQAFADALGNPAFTTEAGAGTLGQAHARTSRLVLAVAALSPLLLAAAIWGWARPGDSDVSAVPDVAARLYLGPDVTMDGGAGFALSPLGDRLAFVGRDGAGSSSIWVRPLSDEGAFPLPGTENGRWPFWAPDGRSLAFVAGGRLRAVELESGAVRVLCETNRAVGGAWADSGTILFRKERVLYQTDAGGGECRPVRARVELGGVSSGAPSFLPDGRRFLLSSGGSVYVGDLDSGEATLIVRDRWNAHFVSPNWMLFTDAPLGGADSRGLLSVMAQRMDLATLEIIGDPRPVLARVSTPGGRASYTASSNGVLVGVQESATDQPLAWVTHAGLVTDTVSLPDDPWTFAPSHDATRVALAGWGFWIHDLQRGVSERILTDVSETRITWLPAWAPGDSLIAFSAQREGPSGLYLYRLADGSVTALVEDVGNINGLAWSLDGTEIAFRTRGAGGFGQAWIALYSRASGEHRMLFSAGTGDNYDALEFSPDGRWLLYASNDSGTDEVYVRPYPSLGAPRRVSSEGGSMAHWTADGGTIFYLSSTGDVMRVAFPGDVDRSLGAPERVQGAERFTHLWGVSDDGSLLLRKRQPPDAGVPPLRVVTGWQQRALGRGSN